MGSNGVAREHKKREKTGTAGNGDENGVPTRFMLDS